MRAARIWLVLSVGLFVAWIGWLAYLAATVTRDADAPGLHPQPVVLSRPQFLVSTLDVIAEVKEKYGKPDPIVTIRGVHWPRAAEKERAGKTITVSNLPTCQGWKGAGLYILPLVPDGQDWQVAAIPHSPGFPPAGKEPPPRIYRFIPETERQLDEMPKPQNPPSPKK